MQILNEQQKILLNDERSALNNLRVALAQFDAPQKDQETLAQSIQQLDELFLLVVVGEFNSGKSTLINALLGQKLLPEGVTPTTTQINILRYGETSERDIKDANQHILTLPARLLAEISIVDTPGTNAIIRAHEAITSQFVPRSDLVLFITSADRPFTESERAFLEKIRNWGKKVVMVINKIDILESDAERQQVKGFVAENANTLLGLKPEIFLLSARQALRAKLGEPDLWQASGFADLETYIHDTLDESGRLRLKLLSPLGVGDHLADQYLELVESRLDLLQADITMLNDVDSQLGLYKEDMQRDFTFRMADIENILFEMEQRGDQFFEDHFRLARIFDLVNKERIQREFESQVVADVPHRIETKVNELIDWLVNADLRQWQAVTEHLAEQRRAHKERIIGDISVGAFHYDRERLMEGVGRDAQNVVDTYDKTREAASIAEGAQMAVAASAAMEISAIGLGTIIAIIATTAAADITGVLMASLVAVLGLFVIPARRRQAKKELHEKVTNLRTQLETALRGHFTHEIDRSVHKIDGAIAPYSRFVRAERGKLTSVQDQFKSIHDELDRLRIRINEM